MVKSFGISQYERDAFQRMQNIIVLEAKIKAYQEVKQNLKTFLMSIKFDLRIFELINFLKEFTEDLEPNNLVDELRSGKKEIRSKEGVFSSWNENDRNLH